MEFKDFVHWFYTVYAKTPEADEPMSFKFQVRISTGDKIYKSQKPVKSQVKQELNNKNKKR